MSITARLLCKRHVSSSSIRYRPACFLDLQNTRTNLALVPIVGPKSSKIVRTASEHAITFAADAKDCVHKMGQTVRATWRRVSPIESKLSQRHQNFGDQALGIGDQNCSNQNCGLWWSRDNTAPLALKKWNPRASGPLQRLRTNGRRLYIHPSWRREEHNIWRSGFQPGQAIVRVGCRRPTLKQVKQAHSPAGIRLWMQRAASA